MKLKMTGDWTRAMNRLKHISNRLFLTFKAEFNKDGELVLERMKEHIYAQDLRWAPLSEHTVELKGGDETIYIETGEFVNGLSVDKIESSNGVTIYVGAKDGKKHKGSGVHMGQLMIWLEYGTDKMPARPLVRPTYDEVKVLLEKAWKQKFKEVCERGD